MTAPITLLSLDEQTLTELRRRYDETSDAETRTRYQMLLLSATGQTSTQIVLRSPDTVVRVLKRFLSAGLDAVPRRKAPGRERRITASWEAELQDEMQVAFHPTLTRLWLRKGRRGQRLVEAPGDNRKMYGFGLVDWRDGWFDGRVAAGCTADVFCEQVRAAVARSQQRGRVAIVIADNLKTHTSAGSLLVRGMLTELKGHLYLVYTPAYDPDANRIEWLWRVSRRVVTHHHHRSTFDLLLKDLQTHFQMLAHTPAAVLQHIGSPFAPNKDQDAPLSLAQAA